MESFERQLCAELKKYKDVIIYGFADIGICVLDYIIDFETSIKIANYSGRVKYFAASKKERSSKRLEKKGIRIRSIYDLTDYAEKALVIIAVQERHHNNITRILDETGFPNRLYIMHEDYCELRKAVENHKTIIDTNIQNYHLNHQLKLDRLRAKVRRGEKAKVFFMTHDSAVFGAASVYRAMLDSEAFDPFIYVVSRRDVSCPVFMEDVNRDIQFFKERGFRVISGYDEYGAPKDMHRLRPDILFYDIPKLYGTAGASYNRMEHLNWEYLTCYIPYGMLMVNSFYYHYHTKCIRETWRFFLDTGADYKRVLADGEFNGFNMVMAGYPKFDEYFNGGTELPAKINNHKPLVIYAPHHSLFTSNNFATFDLYKDKMLSFVKAHPDINFVLKPHPLLYFQIKARAREGMIDFNEEDYEQYVSEWNACFNGLVVRQGDYIRLFQASSCMITDCGSFIGEYLPSGRPCVYLFNPRKIKQEDVYTPLANRILDTCYIVRNEEELDQYMQSVILDGVDNKRMIRETLLKEEFGDIGNAGINICRYLESEVSG